MTLPPPSPSATVRKELLSSRTSSSVKTSPFKSHSGQDSTGRLSLLHCSPVPCNLQAKFEAVADDRISAASLKAAPTCVYDDFASVPPPPEEEHDIEKLAVQFSPTAGLCPSPCSTSRA